MLQEIFYWLIASFVAAGVWRLGVIISGIAQRRNSRRIQRGLTEYLVQKTAA